MPLVRCPNCGLTINLENRKDTDMNLIVNAVQHRARSFTDLLHLSELPRKTLSMRLRELCSTGVIVKADGMYMLNGASGYEKIGKASFGKVSKLVHDRRLRTGMMLISLLVFSSTSVYVLAMLMSITPTIQESPPPQEPLPQYQEPPVIGNFSMSLALNNVTDVYAWEAIIAFDSSKLKVMEVTPGDIWTEYPYFLNKTRTNNGILILAGTKTGSVPGIDATSGEKLATILFGYFTMEYDEPSIVPVSNNFKTVLLNSALDIIPEGISTLVLATD